MVGLHQRRWGVGDHRVLLLHGLSSSGEGWWRVGPALAEAGFEVVAPDLRGHGASIPGDRFTISAYRDDVLGLGAGWDVVVGHSLGGMIAVACQSAEPEFAAALVLVDPALRVFPAAAVLGQLLAEYDTATEETLAASRPRWAAGDIHAKVRALAASGRHVVEATFDALTTVDGWADVAHLAVPTLIIGADPMSGDAMVSQLDGHRAERNPAVRYEFIPGASHSPHRDSYEAFSVILHRFLGELGVSTAQS